jgi:hypothetical protein
LARCYSPLLNGLNQIPASPSSSSAHFSERAERQSRTNYSSPQWVWSFETTPLLDLGEVALVGATRVPEGFTLPIMMEDGMQEDVEALD